MCEEGTRVFVDEQPGTDGWRGAVAAPLAAAQGDLLAPLVLPRGRTQFCATDVLTRHRQEWDLRRDDQIAECMRHSDVVYNLVGRNYPTKRFSLDDVHVSGAARIASLADSLGVARLIHVSHLNADKDSPSAFLRAKAEGEEAVRRAFEGATIVRPGPIYGHEDRLLNSMASE